MAIWATMDSTYKDQCRLWKGSGNMIEVGKDKLVAWEAPKISWIRFPV